LTPAYCSKWNNRKSR